MSVLERPPQTSAFAHTAVLAPDNSSPGNLWGPGPSEIPLVESPTAAEALSLSLLLAIQPEWTTESSRDLAQVEQSQRLGVGRKHSHDPPQFVAPHELTTPPGHSHSYPASSESPEVRGIRHTSTHQAYDQTRPMESRHSYSQGQYLHPSDPEWATQIPRSERVLPSISPRLDSRAPPAGSSYSMPPITGSYGPTSNQVSYQRPTWYESAPPPHPHHGMGQPSMMHAQQQSQAEADSRPKPRCWEHGCNGREFSTFSNLLRHQRERAGLATKVSCPRCAAQFTRKTARDGHVLHAKCKPATRPPDQ